MNIRNFEYLCGLFTYLCQEYAVRYNKSHKTFRKMYNILRLSTRIVNIEDLTPPQCMPDEYKRDSVIDAYRAYYKHGKAHLHKWTNRPIPEWII